MKFTQSDEKLNQLVERRNLSKRRLKTYDITFNKVFKLIGKTSSELIKETKKEQQPFIENNRIPRILEI